MTTERAHSLLLASCFVVAATALVYQAVWLREFVLVLGADPLGGISYVAASLGGLAIGAVVLGMSGGRVRRPWLWFGLLQLGIILSVLLVSVALDLMRTSLTVILPNALLGALVPLSVRLAGGDSRELGPRIGALMGADCAGAALGLFMATEVLIPGLGVLATTHAAMGANLLVCGLMLWTAARMADPETSSTELTDSTIQRMELENRLARPSVLLSGLLAGVVFSGLALIWLRLFVHVGGGGGRGIGAPLGAMLLGIAIGAILTARTATSRVRSASYLVLAQIGALFFAWIAFLLSDTLPVASHWLDAEWLDPLFARAVICMVWLGPFALCVGMASAHALRLLLVEDAGRASATIAWVFAATLVGCSIGVILMGGYLLPQWGFAGAFGACLALGALLLMATIGVYRPPRSRIIAMGLVLGLPILLSLTTTPWKLLTASPLSGSDRPRDQAPAYHSVGRHASIILRDQGLYWELRENGLPEPPIHRARSWPNAYPFPRWLGALPVLARPDLEEMLVIGFGGGSALEIIPRSVKGIDVIVHEMETIEANRRIAKERWRDPLSDSRLHLLRGEARRILSELDPDRALGAIVSQRSHSWSAGTAGLFTEEFFRLAESRLAPDGIFVQWIETGQIDNATLNALLAALTTVFAHVEVYEPPPHSALIFVGSNVPLELDREADRAIRQDPESFASMGLGSAAQIISMRRIDDVGARALAAQAQPNRDDRNLLESPPEPSSAGAIGHALDWARVEDPLAKIMDQRDDGFLVLRELLPFRFERLVRVSESLSDPRDAKLAKAWADMSQGRREAARRSFEALLVESPRLVEARAAMLRLSVASIARGSDPLDFVEAPLSDVEKTLIDAWRTPDGGASAESGADLAGRLAAVPRAHPLWKDAIRQRILLRLTSEDSSALVEARALIMNLLGPHPEASDLFLLARIHAALGEPRVALDALIHMGGRFVWTDPRTTGYSGRAISLIHEIIPDTPDLAAMRATALHSLSR